MANDTKDTTLIIVQGSFQTPLVYKDLKDQLTALGYPTFHPELPSCSNVDDVDFASKTLADDSKVVQDLITQLVNDEGRKVVLIMHSYGGLVGSDAVPEELGYAYRASRGLKGGVVYLFYVSAFILDEGQSVLGTFGESPNNDVKPDGRYYLKNGGYLLYNDLPTAERDLWASRLIPQSHAVQETKIQNTAYKYIPSSYLICQGDNAHPPQYQEGFPAKAGSKVERCQAGHSPMLSWGEELVILIDRAVENMRKQL